MVCVTLPVRGFSFPLSLAPAPQQKALRVQLVSADKSAVSSPIVVGQGGQQLSLKIKNPGLRFDFLFISGLPKSVSLSAGFRAKDKWLVGKGDVETLQLLPPAGFEGGFVLEAQFAIDGQEAAKVLRIPVQIGQKTLAAVGNAGPDTRVETVAPPASMVSASEETEMLKKGGQLLQMGDVAKARLIYEDLAADGSARGAYALAQTFDPNFLKNVYIMGGLRPDVDKARYWYQKAMRLGNADAAVRLGALGGQ